MLIKVKTGQIFAFSLETNNFAPFGFLAPILPVFPTSFHEFFRLFLLLYFFAKLFSKTSWTHGPFLSFRNYPFNFDSLSWISHFYAIYRCHREKKWIVYRRNSCKMVKITSKKVRLFWKNIQFRESVFTFQRSSADFPSIWRFFLP